MTLRLPAKLASQLALVAMVDGQSAAEIVRTALDIYIASRLRDEQFQANLSTHINQAQLLLNLTPPH